MGMATPLFGTLHLFSVPLDRQSHSYPSFSPLITLPPIPCQNSRLECCLCWTGGWATLGFTCPPATYLYPYIVGRLHHYIRISHPPYIYTHNSVCLPYLNLAVYTLNHLKIGVVPSLYEPKTVFILRLLNFR